MCNKKHRKGVAMKMNTLKKFFLPLALLFIFVIMLAGCNQSSGTEHKIVSSSEPETNGSTTSAESSGDVDEQRDSLLENETTTTELYVRFGGEGTPYMMHLYDNDTAKAIAKHVGTSDWRLPIYHYDDYDNWEVMQYYDIPSRYEIPSNPENITAEQAGSVYYSEPNRIILFFRDAEVSGEYTQVGYFDVSDEFVSAVENNPVVQGWGNKLILISTKK